MKDICVFDMDGTLVDSMVCLEEGLMGMLRKRGIPYEEDFFRQLLPMGFAKVAELFLSMGVADTIEEVGLEIKERLVDAYAHRVKAKDGVKEALARLKAEGKRLYVLTASPHLTCDVCLKANGLWELFDQVWSSDDYALTKSDAALYEKVCERIGCEADEVSFFDDALVPLETAARVGMEVWGVWSDQPEGEWQKIQALCGQTVISYREL